jgi:hypothetical protein
MKTAPKSKTWFTLENLDLIIEAHERQVKLRNMYKGNPLKFDLVKCREAQENIDAIEAALSILVFGSTGFTFNQCLDVVL